MPFERRNGHGGSGKETPQHQDKNIFRLYSDLNTTV